MKQNIIFLDIDGVLNCASTKDLTPNKYVGIDDRHMKVLAEIVKENDASIVLTSSWKTECRNKDGSWNADGIYMLSRFEDFGLEIEDFTTDMIFNRGAGIQKWLDSQPEKKSFIILDDINFEDYKANHLLRYFMQTSYKANRGLMPKHIRAARRIFEMQKNK